MQRRLFAYIHMDNVLSCMTWFPILCGQLRQIFVPKHTINDNCSFLDDSSICPSSLSANDYCCVVDPGYNNTSNDNCSFLDDSFICHSSLSPRYNINSLHENSIFLLPDDIIINIFSRLDVECVFQCSRVCRSLFAILSSPHFNAVHCSRATPSLIVQRFILRIEQYIRGVDAGNATIHYVDVVSGNIVELRMNVKARDVWPNIEYMPYLIGSYNGLVLFRNLSGVDSVFFIWNPVTQEQVTVIAPKPDYLVCGLFLHSPTGEFRVLYMRCSIPVSRCLILSLHTKLLREISYCYLLPCESRPPVILNRELHWIVDKDLSNLICHNSSLCSKLILVFKIDSEVFSTIPHPPIENCSHKRHRRMHLLDMEGHLCLCDVTSVTDLDVWVLQKKQNWVKMHHISTESVVPKQLQHEHIFYALPPLEAIYMHNGELLLKYSCWLLYFYHLKKKAFRAIGTDHLGCLTSMVHSSSIVSLNTDPIIILENLELQKL